MMNCNWQRLQPMVLGSYSMAIAMAILSIILKPSANRFPPDIALEEWQEIKSDRLNGYDQIIEGRKLTQKKHALETEVFFIAASRGNTLKLVNQYNAIALKSQDIEIKSREGIGSYGLWQQNKRTYLNTCIHTSGHTAFTPQQFNKLVNANLNSRLLPWILGLQDLRDWGCFWINMSTTSNNLSQKETKELLEQNLIALLKEIEFNH